MFNNHLSKINDNCMLKTHDEIVFTRHEAKSLVINPQKARWALIDNSVRSLLDFFTYPKTFGEARHNFSDRPYSEIYAQISFLKDLSFLKLLTFDDECLPNVDSNNDEFSIHDTLVIIIELSPYCNLGCKYCFRNAPNAKSDKIEVNSEFEDAIIEKVIQVKKKRVIIEFQGGEPLLCFSSIKRISETIKRKVNGQNVLFRLQTNGTLLTKSICDYLNEHNIACGVSLDGPQYLHDEHRPFLDSKGSYGVITKNLHREKQCGREYGIVTVITRPSDIPEIVYSFIHSGYRHFRLNSVFCQGRESKDTCLHEDFQKGLTSYLCTALDIIQESYLTDGMPIRELNIVNMIENLCTLSRENLCLRNPCGAAASMLSISSDGTIYPCHQMLENRNFIMGSIFESEGLTEILDNSEIAQFMRTRDANAMANCRDCKWRNFCGGGCTNRAVEVYNSIFRKDPQCLHLYTMFESLLWKIAHNPILLDALGLSYVRKRIFKSNGVVGIRDPDIEDQSDVKSIALWDNTDEPIYWYDCGSGWANPCNKGVWSNGCCKPYIYKYRKFYPEYYAH